MADMTTSKARRFSFIDEDTSDMRGIYQTSKFLNTEEYINRFGIAAYLGENFNYDHIQVAGAFGTQAKLIQEAREEDRGRVYNVYFLGNETHSFRKNNVTFDVWMVRNAFGDRFVEGLRDISSERLAQVLNGCPVDYKDQKIIDIVEQRKKAKDELMALNKETSGLLKIILL